MQVEIDAVTSTFCMRVPYNITDFLNTERRQQSFLGKHTLIREYDAMSPATKVQCDHNYARKPLACNETG